MDGHGSFDGSSQKDGRKTGAAEVNIEVTDIGESEAPRTPPSGVEISSSTLPAVVFGSRHCNRVMPAKVEEDKVRPPVTPPPPLIPKRSMLSLSLDEFNSIAHKMWKAFYGDSSTLDKNSVESWHKRFEARLAAGNQITTKLHSAIDVVIRENQQCSNPRISKLTSAQVKILKKGNLGTLRHRLETYRAKKGEVKCLSDLMESQTSSLQLCLTNDMREIPDPLSWSPDKCDIPYEAFYAILQKKMAGKNLQLNIDTVAIQIRYVEFLRLAKPEHKELISSILTACGPNLYAYPLRVIQILLSESLLLPEKLQDFIGDFDWKKAFKKLNHCYNIGVKNSQSTNSKNTTPLLHPGKSSVKKTQVDQAVVSAPSITITNSKLTKNFRNLESEDPEGGNYLDYSSWKVAAEQGLQIIDRPALTELGYEKAYARHRFFSGEEGRSEFMRGVLSGFCIILESQEESPLPMEQQQLTNCLISERCQDQDYAVSAPLGIALPQHSPNGGLDNGLYSSHQGHSFSYPTAVVPSFPLGLSHGQPSLPPHLYYPANQIQSSAYSHLCSSSPAPPPPLPPKSRTPPPPPPSLNGTQALPLPGSFKMKSEEETSPLKRHIPAPPPPVLSASRDSASCTKLPSPSSRDRIDASSQSLFMLFQDKSYETVGKKMKTDDADDDSKPVVFEYNHM